MTDLHATAVALGAVVEAALRVPVRDAERYAQEARDHVASMDTIRPILERTFGADELDRRRRANDAAARAADAFVTFRRVLEDVRA